MTDRELRRLSRSELLEMLIAQIEENEKQKAQLTEMKERLESREIAISQAGSIAEAALALSGVFEAAQDAAARYLENVRRLNSEQEILRQRMKAEDVEKRGDTQ